MTFLGPKWSFLIGNLAYSSFIVGNRWRLPETVYPTAILVGVGASIIWTAEGTYLTRAGSNYALAKGVSITSTLGMFNGIFFSIFQCSQVVGNLVAGFVLGDSSIKQEKFELLMYIYMALAGASFISMCFLGEEKPPVHLSHCFFGCFRCFVSSLFHLLFLFFSSPPLILSLITHTMTPLSLSHSLRR